MWLPSNATPDRAAEAVGAARERPDPGAALASAPSPSCRALVTQMWLPSNATRRAVEPVGAAGERLDPGAVARVQLRHRVPAELVTQMWLPSNATPSGRLKLAPEKLRP